MRLIFSISLDLLRRIEDYRYSHRFPTRNAAIVSLIELGLSNASNTTADLPVR